MKEKRIKNKSNNDKCQASLENHRVCKKVYSLNPSIYFCECEINEYLENCTFMKSIINDSVIKCVLDTQEAVPFDSVNKKATYKMDYYAFHIV